MCCRSSQTVHSQAQNATSSLANELISEIDSGISHAADVVGDAADKVVDAISRHVPAGKADEQSQNPFPPALEDLCDLWEGTHHSSHWSLDLVIQFFAIPRVRYILVFFISLTYMILPFFFLVVHDYPSSRPGEIIPFYSTRSIDETGLYCARASNPGLFPCIFKMTCYRVRVACETVAIIACHLPSVSPSSCSGCRHWPSLCMR